jgi:hypothetical protein
MHINIIFIYTFYDLALRLSHFRHNIAESNCTALQCEISKRIAVQCVALLAALPIPPLHGILPW